MQISCAQSVTSSIPAPTRRRRGRDSSTLIGAFNWSVFIIDMRIFIKRNFFFPSSSSSTIQINNNIFFLCFFLLFRFNNSGNESTFAGQRARGAGPDVRGSPSRTLFSVIAVNLSEFRDKTDAAFKMTIFRTMLL